MILINKQNKLQLIVDDSLLAKISESGINQYPNEFGGFLMGKYSDDFTTLTVSDFVLPKKYKGLPYVFERSIDGIKNIFTDLFNRKGYYYVGEWHTHPNGSSSYSQTDLNAMINIAQCSTVQIKNPILLILSVDSTQMLDFSFYVYNNKKLTKYEK